MKQKFNLDYNTIYLIFNHKKYRSIAYTHIGKVFGKICRPIVKDKRPSHTTNILMTKKRNLQIKCSVKLMLITTETRRDPFQGPALLENKNDLLLHSCLYERKISSNPHPVLHY